MSCSGVWKITKLLSFCLLLSFWPSNPLPPRKGQKLEEKSLSKNSLRIIKSIITGQGRKIQEDQPTVEWWRKRTRRLPYICLQQIQGSLLKTRQGCSVLFYGKTIGMKTCQKTNLLWNDYGRDRQEDYSLLACLFHKYSTTKERQAFLLFLAFLLYQVAFLRV